MHSAQTRTAAVLRFLSKSQHSQHTNSSPKTCTSPTPPVHHSPRNSTHAFGCCRPSSYLLRPLTSTATHTNQTFGSRGGTSSGQQPRYYVASLSLRNPQNLKIRKSRGVGTALALLFFETWPIDILSRTPTLAIGIGRTMTTPGRALAIAGCFSLYLGSLPSDGESLCVLLCSDCYL